jgi:pantothenate synthetase
MRLLLYSNRANEITTRLMSVLEAEVSSEHIEPYWTIEDLSRRLSDLAHPLDVVILVTFAKKDLKELLSIREFFTDHRLIIVMPDFTRESTSLAHSLRPRYLASVHSEFVDIALVLSKIRRLLENGRITRNVVSRPV